MFFKTWCCHIVYNVLELALTQYNSLPLVSSLKTFFPDLYLNYPYLFFSKNAKVLCFGFKSVIHFESTFYKVLKNALLLNISWTICVSLFLGFLFSFIDLCIYPADNITQFWWPQLYSNYWNQVDCFLLLFSYFSKLFKIFFVFPYEF